MKQVLRWSLVLGMLLGGLAQAEGRYCDRTIRVAMFEYGLLYRSDSGDGIDVRLLDRLSRRTGCALEFVVMPRARIWAELERGTLDMATAAIPTPERARYGYLLPYLHTRNLALVRGDAPVSWRSLDGFEQSAGKLGVVRSFRHEAAVDALVERLRPQARVVEAADVLENLRLLQEGLVDAVFAQPLVYSTYLSEPQLARLQVLDWVPREQEVTGALILSRKSFSPAQAKAWDLQLAALLKDGTVARTIAAFLPPAQAQDLVYRGPRPTDFQAPAGSP